MGHLAHPYCFFDFINSYGPFEPYGSFGPRGPSLGPWAPMGPFGLFGAMGPSGSTWALSIRCVVTMVRDGVLGVRASCIMCTGCRRLSKHRSSQANASAVREGFYKCNVHGQREKGF